MPGPSSGVDTGATVTETPGTASEQAENSEVLPFGSVAVAVTTSPGLVAAASVGLKLTSPPASVITEVEPRNVRPSPWLEVSHDGFEKNSSSKVVDGVEFSV